MYYTLFILLLSLSTGDLLAGGHIGAGGLSDMQDRPRGAVSGVIPAGRGVIQQQQQQQLGQQNGMQGQQGFQQMQQQVQQMIQAAGRAADSPNRGKADKPLEIMKESEKFFNEANKSTSEAFKQMQQNFAQSAEKAKPLPDNTKITEGIAEDQQKLAEANAKAPPVGSEIVADLIKGQNDFGNTKVAILAQQGAQMAPPPPTVFSQPEPKQTLGDKLRQLAGNTVPGPGTRSTFSNGDSLTGGINEAIPALPGQRIGENNIGHAFMSSRGASFVPDRIDVASRGMTESSSSETSAAASVALGGSSAGSGFAANNFTVARSSSGSGSSDSGVFGVTLGETGTVPARRAARGAVTEDRGPASVEANTVDSIDNVIVQEVPLMPKKARKKGRGVKNQIQRLVPRQAKTAR